MDYDESADILGGRIRVTPQTSSVWLGPGQITLRLGLGQVASYILVEGAPHHTQ